MLLCVNMFILLYLVLYNLLETKNWPRQCWMLILDEQNTLVLELIVDDALIIPIYANLPLLELSHQSLPVLLEHS